MGEVSRELAAKPLSKGDATFFCIPEPLQYHLLFALPIELTARAHLDAPTSLVLAPIRLCLRRRGPDRSHHLALR